MWFIEECGMAAVPWASLIQTAGVCEDMQGQNAELISHTNTGWNLYDCLTAARSDDINLTDLGELLLT